SGVRVAPSERWVHGVSGCPSSYDVFPTVSERALDRLLDGGPGVSRACTGASELAFLGAEWSTSTYAITASRPGWFAFRRSMYGYAGGAHGMFGETCDVASLSNGKLASLQSELPPASLTKLGHLVRAAI